MLSNGRATLLALALLALAPLSEARLLDGFSLEAAWPATNVVVVRETSQTGSFEVLDSLKGSLVRGAVIDVPAMVPLQSKGTRPSPTSDDARPERLNLILFLKQNLSDAASGSRWVPATSNMKTSMVWEQGSKALCFGSDRYFINLELTDCGRATQDMLPVISDMTAQQAELESISTNPDKKVRAEELAPFLLSQYRAARSFVFLQLQSCGEAGAPTVAAVLNDPALLDQHEDVINALVAIQGPRAGPQLTALLESDVQFWTLVAPTLKPDWWDSDVFPGAPLRLRYARTIDLVRALEDIRFSGARATIVALRKISGSLPPLDRQDSTNQMRDECDRVLSELPKTD